MTVGNVSKVAMVVVACLCTVATWVILGARVEAATNCPCVFTDRDLFALAGPNEPGCSGPNPDGGAGEVWGWHCGSPAGPFRVLVLDGCALQVLR